MRWTAASFVLGLLLSSVPAFAEPLTLEVTDAEIAYDPRTSQPLVTFRMSEASRKAFAEFTAQHVGEKIDLRVDGIMAFFSWPSMNKRRSLMPIEMTISPLCTAMPVKPSDGMLAASMLSAPLGRLGTM